MHPNPFHDGTGPLPIDKFSGRSDLLLRLEDMIRIGRFAYLIEGERGYGKTSIRSWLTTKHANDQSTIVCPLDMADFEPSVFGGAGDGLVNRLATAFRASLAEKQYNGQLVTKIKEVFGQLKFKIPIPFTDGVEVSRENSQQPSKLDFLNAIQASAHGVQVKRIVFVIDEISSRQETTEGEQWAWKFCSDFVNQLMQRGSSDKDVTLGVVLLTYPGDINKAHPNYKARRFLSDEYLMKPFDLTEVQELVQKMCVDGNVPYSDDFPRTVLTLSGGSPDLIQSICYGAFLNADTNPSGPIKLQSRHALFAHVSHKAVLQKAIALVEWKMPDFYKLLSGGTPKAVAFRRALKRIGELDMSTAQSLSRSAWIKYANDNNSAASKDFSTFLNMAVDKKLMIVEEDGEDRLRFLGEMLRRAVSIIAESQ